MHKIDPQKLFRPLKSEILGWIIGIVWLVGMIAMAVLYPDPYAQGYRLVFELAIFGGRAVCIADGVVNEFSRAYLLFQCGLQDIAMTLILFPWALRAFHGAEGLGLLGRFLKALHKSTERYHSFLEPFGAIGVWLFVFFPFWSTGVLNGAVLAYLLGIRMSINFAVCFSSHLISTLALLFFYEKISGWMESTGSGAMRFLPFIVLGLLLLGWAAQQLWDRRKAKAESQPKD